VLNLSNYLSKMKITEIAFVVYPVTNLARAREFYEGVLGLEQSRFFGGGEKGMIEYDIGGGTLAIGCGAEHFNPSAGGGCASLEVDDFEEAVKRVTEAKCPVFLPPYESPVCHMMGVSDPDGNSVVIHRRKPGQA
jgi:predicted enzyme related to lactoylglutathione lyase